MHSVGDLHSLGDVRDVDVLSDQEVIDGIAEITHAENALAAHKYGLLAQFSRRGLNLKVGHSSPTHWLASGTRVALGNARRQFDVAGWLTTFPTALDALANGEIHVGHVREIHDGYRHIATADPGLGEHRLADAVADLLGVAFARTPNDVKVRAQELAHAAAEDARVRYEEKNHEQENSQDESTDDAPLGPPPPPVSENSRLNTFDIYEQANGRSTISGDVDKLLGEKLRSALAAHSRPQPAPDGTRDARSASLRQADALSRILNERTHTSGIGSPPARVNATVRLRDLLAPGADCTPSSADRTEYPDWPFDLQWTGPISHSLARVISCDAEFNPIIVDDNGVALAMGSEVRLATREQRTAVTIRDRCCVKCGMPADWCEVHHIVFWSDGGPTDITNLALFCGNCHHDIHNRGWDVAMGEDGHPYVIPPASVDPERKPVSTYHRRRKPAV